MSALLAGRFFLLENPQAVRALFQQPVFSGQAVAQWEHALLLPKQWHTQFPDSLSYFGYFGHPRVAGDSSDANSPLPKERGQAVALFDPEWLNRLRYLSLVSRRLGGGILAARRTRLPAGGTELTGHRDYAPGDDYRYVDWNLCARHDELLSKQFQGQVDCPVYLLLDCSRSMALGSPSKFDVARRALAAVAYVALDKLEQVTVLGFADRILAGLGPVRDRARILKLVRFLEGLAPEGQATDLAAAARQFVGLRRRPGLALVVSDLCDPAGCEHGLDIIRRRGFSLRVIQIYDPAEAEPDVLGDSELVDAETGHSWHATVTERHVRRYRRLYAEFLDSVRSYCARHRARCVRLRTDMPSEDLLPAAIGAKTMLTGRDKCLKR